MRYIYGPDHFVDYSTTCKSKGGLRLPGELRRLAGLNKVCGFFFIFLLLFLLYIFFGFFSYSFLSVFLLPNSTF
jgi:hypothetical protein